MSNIEERNQKSKAFSYFRVTLDMAMGSIYLFISITIMAYNSFGNIELPSTMCHILGPLILAYGLFRIYRGIRELFFNRKNNSSLR